MKHKFRSLIIIFFLFNSVSAQEKYKISLGINFATYLSTESKINYAYKVGLQRNWYFSDKLSVSSGLIYNVKKATLLERTVKPLYFGSPENVYSFDIVTKIGYLDVPIIFQYSILKLKLVDSFIYFGPSILIPITDNSKVVRRKELYLYHPSHPDYISQKNITFKYRFLEDGPSLSPNYSINLGIRLMFQNISFELEYYILLYKHDIIHTNYGYLSGVNDPLNGISTILGISF